MLMMVIDILDAEVPQAIKNEEPTYLAKGLV